MKNANQGSVFVATHQLQKNAANVFSANCDSFLRISPASLNIITTFQGCHRNYHQKFVKMIGPDWGYHQNGLIKFSAEIYHDTSHKLLGDIIRIFWYQPRGSRGYHITKVFGGQHQKITIGTVSSKFESDNASNRLALEDWGGCPQTCLFVIGARVANMNMLFFHEAFVRLTFRDYGNNW